MSSFGLPTYWPWMVAYHHVREPLYRAIIFDLKLSPHARVLDAGSGDGFYSQLLARLLGPAAHIIAVDNNWDLIKLTRDLPRNVQLCVSDLERLGLARASFDAVWLCRSMHSAPDPLGRLDSLAAMLRPGGKLIVVENDTAHYPILPFPVEFEHRLRDARLQYERSHCETAAACERYKSATHLPRWLTELGLTGLWVHTYATEDLAPLDPDLQNYWRQFLAWDAAQLEPYLSRADAARYCDAFNPHSPAYLFSQPSCYCLELTTVACAIRPAFSPGQVSPPPR